MAVPGLDIAREDWAVHTGAVDLLPGERILWEGRPVRHRLFRSVDVLLVPFSIVIFGFAVLWEATALAGIGTADGPPIFFVVWGIPFVLVGLYLLVGRFIVRAVASRRTRYVITDRRALVIGGLSGNRARSEYLASLPPPVIAEGSDGSGSLAFGAFPGISDVFDRRDGWRVWGSESAGTPVLWDIADVRRVRDLVANAQSNQPRST